MIRFSALDRQLAKLQISELPSIRHVQAKQEEMLQLLRQSSADPISYVGLEYCSPEHCARTNCSEACWFGTLQRRVPQILAIRALMDRHDRPLHKIVVHKPEWGCPSGWLHWIKPRTAKALMTRVFNGMCSISVTAVGMFKVYPFGPGRDLYLSEIHMIVGGANEEQLQEAFRPVQRDASVRISKIEDVNDVIDQVTKCNSPRLWQPRDDPPDAVHLTEFYAWLAEMKIGARIFRYGCDESFDLITYRKITYKPRIKKERSGRRRYYKRRKRSLSRPWIDDSAYYED
jgi:hypothetical protein